ncbi:MAG: hypothetical protein COB15_11940 [Flavobacteriales bacterium]|nr:MAG: hypothetical protein COB15_11940 [Flavobacteriales bacterium]
MKGKLILTSLIVLLVASVSVAQQLVKPESLDVHLELVSDSQNLGQLEEQEGDPLSQITATTTQKVKYVIGLLSELNISKIHAKMGTTDGGNEVFEIVANFDGLNLPEGVTLTKTGNLVYLELGEYIGIQTFYAEVVLEDNAGGFTLPLKNNNSDN